jgi:hypothetical protein
MPPPGSDFHPEPPPLRAFVVAVILTLPESGDRGEPSAFAVGPIPCILPPGTQAQASSGSGHRADWLRDMLSPHLRQVEVANRFRHLPPRPWPPEALLLTVWATGRRAGQANTPAYPPLSEALESIGRRIGDPSFAAESAAAIRGASSSDPFLHRSLGEEARLRAAAEEELHAPPGRDLPAAIAILPPTFSLTELQTAIAALVGRPVKDLESTSNFRRRIQEFLHRGVLVEDESGPSPSDRERSGRPPRRYRFDPEAWRRWLLQRTSADRRSPDRTFADARFAESSFLAPDRPRFPTGESPEEVDLAMRRLARGERPFATELDADVRISRLERLLEQVLRDRNRPGSG